jgi:thiol-disulfide isomerase/thioredoxin
MAPVLSTRKVMVVALIAFVAMVLGMMVQKTQVTGLYRPILSEGFQAGSDKFVMYYADWCPHCKSVKPIWEQWSKKGSMKINGKTVFLDKVEESEKEKAAGKPVKGYPTFLLEKADGKIVEYEGGRNVQGWEAFLKKNL